MMLFHARHCFGEAFQFSFCETIDECTLIDGNPDVKVRGEIRESFFTNQSGHADSGRACEERILSRWQLIITLLLITFYDGVDI